MGRPSLSPVRRNTLRYRDTDAVGQAIERLRTAFPGALHAGIAEALVRGTTLALKEQSRRVDLSSIATHEAHAGALGAPAPAPAEADFDRSKSDGASGSAVGAEHTVPAPESPGRAAPVAAESVFTGQNVSAPSEPEPAPLTSAAAPAAEGAFTYSAAALRLVEMGG